MSLLKLKNIAVLGVIAFLVISFWSLYSMPINESGMMVNCPFMNGLSNFCQMSVPEHISQWRQLFAAIQGHSLLLSLFALSALFSVSSFNTGAAIQDRLKFQSSHNYFHRKKPEVKLFDHLVLAFSQGILNPKIYNSVD